MEILGIGYAGFETPSPEGWRDYAAQVLGMEVSEAGEADEGSLYLRMDDRPYRMVLHPGPIDRVAYIGWELAGRDDYRAALARFAECGVEVEVGDKALCDRRGVREVACFRDPAGYHHEIFYAPRFVPGSFQPGRPHAAFEVGDKGLGHLVLISPEPIDKIERLFQDVMGFRFVTHGAAPAGAATFLNPKRNPRSHCIAYAHIPGRMGIHHLGLGLSSLDSLGITYDIAQKRQVPLHQTLGRHTQDPVVSFYHFSPGGFIVETFWEEKPYETEGPTVELYPNSMSLWGHETVGPQMPTTIRDAAELR